ncbi:MAG: hypothetical protein Q7R34_12755, partial [Dehalococcoidia bacterium]|nr:hypothetical protein [Dehalococcoidia bacterium]
IEGAAIVGNLPVGYDTLDESIAYNFAKAIHLGYNGYKDIYPSLKYFSLEESLNGVLWGGVFDLSNPLHPGVVKYLKEIGAWKDKHEAWQNERLRIEDARIKAWALATAEAKSKGIPVDQKNDTWVKLWQSYLDNIK